MLLQCCYNLAVLYGIVALCETRLNEQFRPNINNYDIYSHDRNRQGGGVAILLRKNLGFTQIVDENINQTCKRNDIEHIMEKIWLSTEKSIFVCSLYSPPRGSNCPHTEPQAWLSLLRYCTSFNPIVICGDVNGKSALWSLGILGPDSEGNRLENAISQLDLSCLNDGNYTWASADFSSTSALDITLASSSIATKCLWNVLGESYGSDHFPIIITISDDCLNSSFGRPSFSTARVDWGMFQCECSRFVDRFRGFSGDLNNDYNELVNAIHLALTTAGAKKQSSRGLRKKPPTTWWDDKCNDRILQKN
ncbi:uncharacterized protein LOC115243977 [Formica exsecta]|uniref:uncharacterized protein LOC115243977 n=1 Tax=Formica exsecta TaxID=72781 RepID=UPI001142A27C|nr:uncharacterized protein LOC115243977 [Formica exsecta]